MLLLSTAYHYCCKVLRHVRHKGCIMLPDDRCYGILAVYNAACRSLVEPASVDSSATTSVSITASFGKHDSPIVQ